MKKHLIFLFLGLFYFYNSSASNDVINALSQVPDTLYPYCYNYYAKLDGTNLELFKTYKVNINYDNLVITQNNYLLPYKKFGEENNMYEYTITKFNEAINDFPYDFMSDENKETYWDVNIENLDTFELNFDEEINDFDFNFDYDIKNFSPLFYIFKDGNYKEVKRESIENFSFSKMKILFKNRQSNSNLIEKLRIKELSFTKKEKTILLKSFFNEDIEFFADNNCKNPKNPNFKHYNFEINADTKTIEITLEKNPYYNVYTQNDTDSDGISDDEDNCINIYNPKQEDTNSDGIGDICSDNDKDGIV